MQTIKNDRRTNIAIIILFEVIPIQNFILFKSSIPKA